MPYLGAIWLGRNMPNLGPIVEDSAQKRAQKVTKNQPNIYKIDVRFSGDLRRVFFFIDFI